MRYKRIIAVAMALCLCASAVPVSVLAANIEVSTEDNTNTIGEIGGYLAGSIKTVNQMETERMFSNPTGHGFAAEQGNNLIDKLQGKNASVVGGDNAKNGADRKIINRDGSITWIQDKYYSTASKSVEAAFDNETGNYRYIDADNKPMQLEVPADQYEKAVEAMEKKIEEGKVPGVSDTAEAKNLVRKGNITYEQAKNIAKAGTVDSLKYDAANGAVTAACAFGISFALDFAVCKLNGYDTETALKDSTINGIKTGSVVFASYVISSQIVKTGAASALAPTTDAIANQLGEKTCQAIIDTFGVTASGATKESIIKQASKLLQNTIVSDAVIVVVLSADDVYNLFAGRISTEQLLKNLTVTVASVGGATVGSIAGAAAGTAIAPGVGTAVGKVAGGIVGGTVAGIGSNWVAGKVYEGDAQQMYEIISAKFEDLSEDYMITQEEGDAIVTQLQEALSSSKLKDMYASEDRESFAVELMTPMFEDQLANRGKISTPSEDEVRYAMLDEMQGIVFVH